MSSKQNLAKAKNRSDRGTGSKTGSFARSQTKEQRSGPSESKANSTQKHERKDPQGLFHAEPHHRSVSGTSALDTPIPSPQSAVDGFNDTDISGVQNVVNMQNQGSHNQLHVGDDNRGNRGIIGRNNILVQYYNNSQAQAGDGSTSMTINFRSMVNAIAYIDATQKVLGALFGFASSSTSTSTEFDNKPSEGKVVGECIGRLVEFINPIIEGKGPRITQAHRNHLRNLLSELGRARKQLFNADDNSVSMEAISLDIVSKLRLFLFESQMEGHIPSEIVVEELKKRMKQAQQNAEAASPRKLMKHLLRAKAAYDDYVSGNRRRVSCFKGTRQAFLKEMGEWVSKAETNIFALSGLAGIGKSTIAQTIAERAANVGLLGASFFFSRDEAERRTAEKFFTTIAFQLCVHDPEFASAIESTLKTEQGKDAVTKYPFVQLETLILEPLRKLAPRRVLIVVDALDECDEEDGATVLAGLHMLVRNLPSFKVILTTRPQQHSQLLDGEGPHKVFHLHNIEDKIVDSDIRIYLKHYLSRKAIRDHFKDPLEDWNASDDEIELLVKASGRLFIIASTSVLFVLDKAAHDPEHRIKQLLAANSDGKTPLEVLNNFYTVVLRSALPKGSDSRTVARYQLVLGAIMIIATPLPIEHLAKLIGYQPTDVRRVLGKLRSVILIDDANDVPTLYHKSFPDYVQDPARCEDRDLLIDLKARHMGMALNCFRMMNQQLRQNIFGLGDPQRFMDNAILRKRYITEDRFVETFPFELRYACSNWAIHVEGSVIEDQTLIRNLETFFNEHLLHWFEALSWIRRLELAHHSLLMLQQHSKSISSDLDQLVADGFRFIAQSYEIIRRSALHTYHSALPFTPTKTSLYKRYSKQMTFCQTQGGPEKWDALITKISMRTTGGSRIVFSSNSKMFACLDHSLPINSVARHGPVKIYDAVGGIPIGKTGNGKTAIANDFSKVAVADDSSIKLYNVKGITPVAAIKPSATAADLELSPDGSRLVVGLGDGTIGLWDTEKCQLIQGFGEWKKEIGVAYSSDGNRIAFASCDRTVKLFDGQSGSIVADLVFPVPKDSKLKFSGDGSCLVCLSAYLPVFGNSTLRLWRSEDGALIGMAESVGYNLAISTDGSLLATGERNKLQLWNSRNKGLALLEILDLESRIWYLEFSKNGLLGIAHRTVVDFYDINSRTFIARLPCPRPSSLAFSPDCTRLAVDSYHNVELYDMVNITAAYVESRGQLSAPVLSFSPDCSLLASGHLDGTIKLWDTSSLTQPLAVCNGHLDLVTALAFSIDGRVFASGSKEGIVRLWKGRKGVPSGSLKCSGKITAVALSSNLLAAATEKEIMLWGLDSRVVISTFEESEAQLLTLSHHDRLLASVTRRGSSLHHLTLWDIGNRTRIGVASFDDHWTTGLAFSPGGSRLAVQCYTDLRLFSVHDKISENKQLPRLDLCTRWHEFPVWLQRGNIVTQFPQGAQTLTVLYQPNGLNVRVQVTGSSMIAFGCGDGRVLVKAI